MKLFYSLLLILSSLYALGQQQEVLLNDVLGHGFDIRYVDALDWGASSKGRALVKGGISRLPIKTTLPENFHFVTTPYEFEEKVLRSDSLVSPFSGLNSWAHYKGFGDQDMSKTLLVYAEKRLPIVKRILKSESTLTLDSAMVEDFRRLGRDITAAGFVWRYGTHYAQEVTYGGIFLKRNSINNEDFIYSPYTKLEFKNKVIEDVIASHTGATDPDPYINSGGSNTFTTGGDVNKSWFTDWALTVPQKSVPIEVNLQTYSNLFSNVQIPDIEDKQYKISLLDSIIKKATRDAQASASRPQKSDFYKKYSLRFAQTLTSLVKKSAGTESGDKDAYTGDLFFGGFSKDDAILKTAPFISRGGIRLETLITDEKITLNKRLVITVKPDDLDRGYVSVWDDTKKLEKSPDRKRLRVAGPEEAKTAFKEALTQNRHKNVEITTIDGDIYEVAYMLTLEKEKKLLENNTRRFNDALQTEIVAAANVGNLKTLKSLFIDNEDRRIPGLISAIITSKQSNEMLNFVLDKGVKATVADLELLFLEENFNLEKILTLLERGTPHKNNMIYKAVAYKSDKIIYALLREGAVPKNNDLSLALNNYHYPTVKALMSQDFEAFTAGKNELLLATENDDANLAQKFVNLGATADAYILEKALLKENETLKNIIVPVTDATNETLEVVAALNETDLFKYFVSNNASITSNKSVEIATDNNNTEILDLALKNGGEPTDALAYAIKVENKFAIDVSLKNKAKPDILFAYALKKEDAQLFNDALTIYGGTPAIALKEAVKQNNVIFAESVIQNKREEINTSESISLAVSKENLDMVKLLITNNANPTEGIREAINVGSESITDYLVSKGAETINPELLKDAVKNENLAIAKILVEKGKSDVDNAIVEASETGNTEITQYLLDKGAQPEEALAAVMETENEDVILLLLERNKDPIKPEFLLNSARKGNTKVLNHLLDQDLDPTPAIENAVRYKHIKALNLLLDRGGIPKLDQINTAFEYGFISGALALITHPMIDLNKPFLDGSFAIHKIATLSQEDATKVVTALINAKANLNATNTNGETVLHLVAKEQTTSLKLVIQLLESGANPLILNKSNKTASDLAVERAIKTTLKKAARNRK